MNSILAHINPRGPGFFPPLALSTFTPIQTSFEHASGSFGTRAALKKSIPQAENQLRNFATDSKAFIQKVVFPQL
jgi:hypothetical protein